MKIPICFLFFFVAEITVYYNFIITEAKSNQCRIFFLVFFYLLSDEGIELNKIALLFVCLLEALHFNVNVNEL